MPRTLAGSQWYYLDWKGVLVGPVSASQVALAVLTGSIESEGFVRHSRQPGCVRAREVAEIAAAISALEQARRQRRSAPAKKTKNRGRTIVCAGCQREFSWTARQQAYRTKLGLGAPTRCGACTRGKSWRVERAPYVPPPISGGLPSLGKRGR
jgi:hypothetical protein